MSAEDGIVLVLNISSSSASFLSVRARVCVCVCVLLLFIYFISVEYRHSSLSLSLVWGFGFPELNDWLVSGGNHVSIFGGALRKFNVTRQNNVTICEGHAQPYCHDCFGMSPALQTLLTATTTTSNMTLAVNNNNSNNKIVDRLDVANWR